MNPAAMRGAVLVVVGVVIGAFVLGNGFDGSGSTTVESAPSSDTGDTTEAPSESDEAGTDAATDTGETGDTGETAEADAGVEQPDDGSASTEETAPLTPSARPPAEVKVLVANGSGVQGAAGRSTETLLGQGYNALSPVNADSQSETRIYFVVGFDADAEAVAQVLTVGPDRLAPMIDPPPGGVDLRGADVLVLLGPDEVAQPG